MRFFRIWMMAVLGLGWALPLLAQTSTPPAAPPRTWTTTEGKTFQATVVSVQGTQVTVRLASGQLAAIGLTRLSPADRAYVEGIGAAPTDTPATVAAATARGAIEKRVWPQKVEVDSRAIDVSVVSEDLASRKCVYHSRNFEFTTEDKIAPSVMKDLARTFEVTRSLMEGLPWGLNPKPPAGSNLFTARLFTTREDYVAAGGGAKSGAMFKSSDGSFLVPFKSLGLEARGKTWARSGKFEDNLVVLEISKQMMYGSYSYLPSWVWQGAAEYASMLPENAGVIHVDEHEHGLKEYLKHWESRGIPPGAAGSAYEVMQLPNEEWSKRIAADDKNHLRLHVNSGLLVYYFCHLDGDGKGTRFLRFMDKIADAREGKTPPGARSSFGASQMDVLFDGRSKEELNNAVVEGFKKIGIQW